MSGLINFCGLNLCTVSVPELTEIQEKVSLIKENDKQQTNRLNNLDIAVSKLLEKGQLNNVVDMIINGVPPYNKNFSTLVSYLTQFELVNTLKDDKYFTVFAPTDEAFSNIASLTPTFISQDTLKGILLSHVVQSSEDILGPNIGSLDPGKYYTLKTLGTKLGLPGAFDIKVQVQLVDKEVKAYVISPGSTVLLTNYDIYGYNGSVQILNNVLLPPIK